MHVPFVKKSTLPTLLVVASFYYISKTSWYISLSEEYIVAEEKYNIHDQYIQDCKCTRKYLWPHSVITLKRYNSSCSDEGTFYKNGQNIVSFSLHLPNKNEKNRSDLYKEGLLLNLERMRKFYKGYSLRVYTDVDPDNDFCDIICQNSDLFWCDVRRTPGFGNLSGMFCATWRFLPLGDPSVDIFLSRDLDSVITPREVAVVRDWLLTSKPIHLMRDYLGGHNLPILAGMWGVSNSRFSLDAGKLRNEIVSKSLTSEKDKSLDQAILNDVIFYPLRKHIVAYDSYHCDRWKKFTVVKPFPVRRVDRESDFVGNVELGRMKYNLSKCPVQCRPSYGKDWEYC